jgi:mono/diheme cytochrome c family protein
VPSACLVVVAIAAGCGSGGSGTTTGSGTGQALFISTGCGSCHTLAAAGTSGRAGPNLDHTRSSYARVVEKVTDGGGVMPAYADSLTGAQIRAIARYVSGGT